MQNKNLFSPRHVVAMALLSLCSQFVLAANVANGKEKSALCAGCHGHAGIGLSDEFPNLAGQKKTYLISQMKAFKNRMRRNPTMEAMVARLSDQDIEDLAAYYNKLQAQASPAALQQSATGSDRASAIEFPEVTFITMKGSGSVESFPSEKVWQGGPNMLYNAVTPDGTKLLATSPSTGSVYCFDARTGKTLKIIKVGKAPKGVKISPDGGFAYVSNEGSDTISVLDLQRLKLVDTIKVEKAPHNVRFTRDGKLAYVTLQGGAGIGLIDTRSRKMTRIIPVPGITGPHNIDLSADEKTAYVRDFVHHVAVVDLQTAKVRKVIKVGSGHGGIDVAPNDRFVATAAIGDKVITVIDTRDLSTRNIEVGNGPHGIRASRDSRWLYVSLTKENSIAVINTASMRVEKKIAAEKFPFWVAVQGNP